MKRSALRLTTFITGIVLTASASAAVINIDFGPLHNNVYSGRGVLGNASDTFWNSVDASGAANLLFADGTTPTGSGISLSFGSSFSNVPGSADNWLLGDRVISIPSQTETITISGLAPNATFDIALYNAFYAQEYSAQGELGLVTVNTAPDSDSRNTDYANWEAGVEYAILASVTSDGTGTLSIQDVPTSDGWIFPGNSEVEVNSALAGMQIQQVSTIPVPAAVWLFGSGLLGLAGIARRRSR